MPSALEGAIAEIDPSLANYRRQMMAMDGLDSLGGSRLRNGHSMTHASRIADQDRTESGNDTKTKNFQEVPSPAVVSADAELGQILHEVNRISMALKSSSPDSETLRIAVHPAVWSALTQALLNLRASLPGLHPFGAAKSQDFSGPS